MLSRELRVLLREPQEAFQLAQLVEEDIDHKIDLHQVKVGLMLHKKHKTQKYIRFNRMLKF